MKNREFDKEVLANGCLERVTIVLRQGTSENSHWQEKPTQSKTDSSDYFGIALLMVIAANRFKHAESHPKIVEEGLSKEEMEAMLTSATPLPSFLSMSFTDPSPKAKQRGAVYALNEFLKRSQRALTI